MLTAVLLSVVVQATQRDVSAHSQAADQLAKRLVQAGFPDLRGWVLRKIQFPANTIILEPLDAYLWVDPRGKSRNAFTVYGAKRPLPTDSEQFSIDDLVSRQLAVTRLRDGSWYASGLDKALLSIAAAGRLDAVARVIERDQLDRTSVEAFSAEMLHGVAVPGFNDAVRLYQQGDLHGSREMLARLMAWLESVPGETIENTQRAETNQSIVARTYALAGEVRRRLRSSPIEPFNSEVAQTLDEEARIAYLIERLSETRAITSRPGGARFHAAAIPLALIEIGKPALPALREVVESDPRLTTASYSRFDGELLYVYSVADVARQIIRQIEGPFGPATETTIARERY